VAGAGQAGEAARLQRAAQELEGLFLGHLLKAMRSSAAGAERGDAGMYRDLFDEAVGQALARAGGIGLARAIVEREAGRDAQKGSSPPPAPPISTARP